MNSTHKLAIEVVTILVKKNHPSQEIRPVVDVLHQTAMVDNQYLCIRKLKHQLIQELVVELVMDVDRNFQLNGPSFAVFAEHKESRRNHF